MTCVKLNRLSWLTLLLLTPQLAIAQTGPERPTHRVPWVEGTVKVDGVLDEPLWREALVLDLVLEVRPGENIPAPVRTQALLAYGPRALYVAFKAFDREPEQIRARLSDRDTMDGDDWVGVILDTFNDQRRSVDFLCNPLGVQTDLVESTESEDMAWDAIWDSAGRITAEGYQVEMVIPFSSLRFQRGSGDQTWGIDLIRSWPRDVDHRIGLFPRDRNDNCYLCQADRAVGFAGASPGRNIELDPTLSALAADVRDGLPDGPFVEDRRTVDLGLTGTWGVTPNLTLGGAVNPDFSQVEADAAQLDINTQFALFFPEKRPFFLEGGDLFETRIDAVYTRTVADPEWGAKLTGKAGAHALGFFTARDTVTNLVIPGPESSSATSLEEPTTDTVLRYRRDVGESSTLGFLATDREGTGYFNRVAGFDGVLRASPTDAVRFQLLDSSTRYPEEVRNAFDQPDGDFDGSALDVKYLHDTRTWDWYGVYKRVSPGFRADLGYVPQVGYDFVEVGWGHTWNRDPGSWYTILNVGSGYEEEHGADGGLLHHSATFWFNYQGPYESHVNVNAYLGRRSYQSVEFDDDHFDGCLGFRPFPDLWLHVHWEAGDRIDYANVRAGKVLTLFPTVQYRLGRHLLASLDHTYQTLDVEGGRLYTANVSELRLVYQITQRAFVRAILQRFNYRRDADLYTVPVEPHDQRLLSQLLFSYKINPRTVLFLGYSDAAQGTSEFERTQVERSLFFKIGYAFVL